MNVTVNVRELLHFFDESPDARPSSNSIKTLAGEEFCIAVLMKYFDDLKFDPRLLTDRCTTKGAWLDGWVKITINGQEIYHQVEVKTWSFHGFGGGQPLSVNCNDDELRAFKTAEWLKYWDATDMRFIAPGLNKVLKTMKPPGGKSGITVVPLACLWAAVHPSGDDIPLFDIIPSNAQFDIARVFSVSAYLRNYIRDFPQGMLSLDLPKTKARLDHLGKIFAS